jgi:ring-1,2-phenylacetyl-CoA epoxidase subunit PaaC
MRRSSAHSPGGDFADTVLRNLLLATWLKLAWQRLQSSSDAELAAIAGKAVKEARYHQQHAADWVVRLGDGTDESHDRMPPRSSASGPTRPRCSSADAVDAAAEAGGLGPARAACCRLAPRGAIVLDEATLKLPADVPFVSTGTQGVHSEHMGFILAEMQSLQRQHPGGAW